MERGMEGGRVTGRNGCSRVKGPTQEHDSYWHTATTVHWISRRHLRSRCNLDGVRQLHLRGTG